MALAIMLYLPVLFERVRRIRKTDTRHSAEYIKQRVESIYFDVTHFYNQLTARMADPLEETGTVPETWPDFDRLYCSEAWNKCMAECDNETGNYWLGQEPDRQTAGEEGFLYVNKVEVIDRTGDQATVSLMHHNGNRAVPVLLVMVFERDDWHIDNMTFYWNEKPSTRYYDWRQEMEQQTITIKYEKT